jgi:hypothetical protein
MGIEGYFGRRVGQWCTVERALATLARATTIDRVAELV